MWSKLTFGLNLLLLRLEPRTSWARVDLILVLDHVLRLVGLHLRETQLFTDAQEMSTMPPRFNGEGCAPASPRTPC